MSTQAAQIAKIDNVIREYELEKNSPAPAEMKTVAKILKDGMINMTSVPDDYKNKVAEFISRVRGDFIEVKTTPPPATTPPSE